MEPGSSHMVRLTGAKVASNVSMRWVPFFLVTLGDAFDASTATMAAILGFGEMVGLTTLAVGKRLDAGRERAVLMVSLVAIAVSGIVALGGSVVFFALSYVLAIGANAHVTVGGHAWISARVAYDRRGRFIGLYETSWAFGLLVGAPLMALLINLFNWRAPYVAIVVIAAVAAAGLWSMPPIPPIDAPTAQRNDAKPKRRLTVDAVLAIGASAMVALAGLTTIVIVGTWLSEDLGVSTGGIGGVAMAFGAVELASSSGSAAFADRLGKRRSTMAAAGLVLAGLAVIVSAGSSLLVAALGLLLFFLGFEYAIVTSFTLVSESMPDARGRVIAANSAAGTLVRGAGAVAAGVLFEAFGITGPAAVSAVAAALAVALLALVGRRRRH